jgi:hypothetical protein
MYTKEHDALRPPSRPAVTTADVELNIQLKQMANRMRVTTLGYNNCYRYDECT